MKLHPSVFLLTPLLLIPACVEAPTVDEPAAAGVAAGLPDRGNAHVWTPGGVLEVAYERDGDRVVFHGDMSTTVEDFQRAMISDDELAALAAGESRVTRAAVRALGRYRWPDGVVPFAFAADLTAAQRTAAEAAMTHWENNTNFEFVPRDGEADFVEFRRGNIALGSCRADVGRLGGEQEVLVQGCSSSAIIHELGHTVGFYHEQTRYDRDQYVTINWNNISTCNRSNFERYVDYVDPRDDYQRDGADAGPYDYASIMHYRATQCGNGLVTIVPAQSGVTLGNTVLSPLDIEAANRLILPGGVYDDGAEVTIYSGGSYTGTSVPLGLGYHDLGDFGAIGNNNISSLSIPAGLAIEGIDNDVDGPRRLFGTSTATMPAGWDNTISWLYVHRAVRVYRDANQGGIAQGLTEGTWRADENDLDTVGNDKISSIYVPPGLVAELCWSETGVGSTGAYCQTFEGGAKNVTGTLDNQTSLVRVKAAVTVFQEGNLWGNQKSFPIGTYNSGSFAPVANDSISSLTVGDGLKATLCTTSTGGAPCEVFRGDVHFVGGRLNDEVSWIRVEPNTDP
jgi:hypothetical protein